MKMGDVLEVCESEFSHFYDGNRSTAVNIPYGNNSYSDTDAPISSASASPLDLKRAISADQAHDYAASGVPSSSPRTEDIIDGGFEEADEGDAEDDSETVDNEEEEALREAEEKNFALAKQLEEAHNVVERARMSILMTGDEGPDDFLGLSADQINLFKKLTTQAEERESIVDHLHPADESDSDSEDGEGDSGSALEEEGDDGVWI